jgi:hypothetical protein
VEKIQFQLKQSIARLGQMEQQLASLQAAVLEQRGFVRGLRAALEASATAQQPATPESTPDAPQAVGQEEGQANS